MTATTAKTTAITGCDGNVPPTAITFRYGGGGGSPSSKDQLPPQLTEPLPPLPALRCLGDLADMKPVVVVDSREQTPLPFRRLAVTTAALLTGDYSFHGGEDLFAIERKTIQDLAACCTGENRARFFRELHRLRGFAFKRLVVVGAPEDVLGHSYVGHVTPKAVLATLAAKEARFDVPVVFCPSPEDAARKIEIWAWYYARELVEATNTLARRARAAGHTG